jgi:hypothetical protein
MCPKIRLISQIRKRLATAVAKVCASEFKFNPPQAVEDHNLTIFEKNVFDYMKVIQSQQGSTAWFGSEFGNCKLLELIFTAHESWGHMHAILSGGGSLPLKEINDETRQEDNA